MGLNLVVIRCKYYEAINKRGITGGFASIRGLHLIDKVHLLTFQIAGLSNHLWAKDIMDNLNGVWGYVRPRAPGYLNNGNWVLYTV